MNEINLYEFIGIMIGDGCLLYYPNKSVYGVEITGNVIEERDYYEKIARFLRSTYSINPKVFTRNYKDGSKGLKLVFRNKEFTLFLRSFGLTRNKTYTVTIPEKLLEWKKAKHVLRGIFETDGSLYFSRSRITTKMPTYPRLEITTVSIGLAEQIIQILKENGFRVQSHKNRSSIVIYMSGENMLYKWIREVGFSSAKNRTKYLLWKKLGYYIPRLSLPDRISLLCVRGKVANAIPCRGMDRGFETT